MDRSCPLAECTTACYGFGKVDLPTYNPVVFRAFETRKGDPERDTRVEAGREIKWAYAASLPPVEGQPNIELVLGVPQGSGWLRPDDTEGEPSVYRFELPVNILAGNEKSQMIFSGLVRAESPENIVFKWGNLGQQATDYGTAWMANADRIGPQAALLLCDAVVDQCKAYLAAQRGRVVENQH